MKWILITTVIMCYGCVSHVSSRPMIKWKELDLWDLYVDNDAWSREDRIKLFEDCSLNPEVNEARRNNCKHWLVRYLIECSSGYACESDRKQALSVAIDISKRSKYGTVYVYGNGEEDHMSREDNIDLLARAYYAAGDSENAYKVLYQVHNSSDILSQYSKVIIDGYPVYEPCEKDCGKNYLEVEDLFKKSLSAGDRKTQKKLLYETKVEADKRNIHARESLIRMYVDIGKIKEAEKYRLACLDDEYDGFQGYDFSPLLMCNLFISGFYSNHGNDANSFKIQLQLFYLFNYFDLSLAYYYHEGKVVKQNKEKASYFYELSANSLFADWSSIGMAAYMNAVADGIERDCSKAKYFVERLYYYNKSLNKDVYQKEYDEVIKKIRNKDNSCGI